MRTLTKLISSAVCSGVLLTGCHSLDDIAGDFSRTIIPNVVKAISKNDGLKKPKTYTYSINTNDYKRISEESFAELMYGGNDGEISMEEFSKKYRKNFATVYSLRFPVGKFGAGEPKGMPANGFYLNNDGFLLTVRHFLKEGCDNYYAASFSTNGFIIKPIKLVADSESGDIALFKAEDGVGLENVKTARIKEDDLHEGMPVNCITLQYLDKSSGKTNNDLGHTYFSENAPFSVYPLRFDKMKEGKPEIEFTNFDYYLNFNSGRVVGLNGMPDETSMEFLIKGSVPVSIPFRKGQSGSINVDKFGNILGVACEGYNGETPYHPKNGYIGPHRNIRHLLIIYQEFKPLLEVVN